MNKLEVLADAIMVNSGYTDPSSEAYKARNPGALVAVSKKHIRRDSGLRDFEKGIDGYAALIYDLERKCSGESRSGLKKDSTIHELSNVLGFLDGTAKDIAQFVQKALKSPVTEDTPLSYFVEE